MVEDKRALKSRLSWKMTIVAIIITQGRPLNPKTLAGAAEAPAQLDLSRGPWNNGNNCKSLEDTGRRSHPVIAPLTASLDLSNVLAIWEASADTPGLGSEPYDKVSETMWSSARAQPPLAIMYIVPAAAFLCVDAITVLAQHFHTILTLRPGDLL